jgi:hypothetical protein
LGLERQWKAFPNVRLYTLMMVQAWRICASSVFASTA